MSNLGLKLVPAVHLATWMPRWANAIIEQTCEPLYAALTGLLKAGVEQVTLELKHSSRPFL